MSPDDGEERTRYTPDEDGPLSAAVLEAIGDQIGKDVTMADFRLYDDIDPDALDRFFREDSSANTTVQFDTDDVTVTLWGDGAGEIRVTSQQVE